MRRLSSRGPRPSRRAADDPHIRVSSDRFTQHLGAGTGELIISTWWPALELCAFGGLPSRSDASSILEPAQDRIDSTALESSVVEDVEPMPHAA
jgi:hypothetical protein